MKFLANPVVFVVAYLLLMVPTYLLPWLGLRLELLGFLGGGYATRGPAPTWWAQAWCLAMLTTLAWARGKTIGKPHLAIFPFLAAMFDLVPGLKLIPLVPTVMHLLAMIIGVQSGSQQESRMEEASVDNAKSVGILTTLVAICGIAWTMSAPKPVQQDPFARFGEGLSQWRAQQKAHQVQSKPTPVAPVQQAPSPPAAQATQETPQIAERPVTKPKRKKASHSESMATNQQREDVKNKKASDEVEIQYISIH